MLCDNAENVESSALLLHIMLHVGERKAPTHVIESERQYYAVCAPVEECTLEQEDCPAAALSLIIVTQRVTRTASGGAFPCEAHFMN
jgi:hypothetical protein